MNTSEIKKNSRNAFYEGDFEKAFDLLWSLGIKDFYTYYTKDETTRKRYPKKKYKSNWLNFEKSAQIFWSKLFTLDKYFDSICRSELFEQFMHQYFSVYKRYHRELELTQLEKNHSQGK